jgi:hypothetical protein
MKQLIEDLISAMEYHVEQTRPVHMTTVAIQAAKDALKAMPAAQPAQPSCPECVFGMCHCGAAGGQKQPAPVQEPVAVVSGYYGGQCVVLPTNPARLFNSGTAFYTAPPAAQKPWVGLTDEEIEAIPLRQPNGFAGFARAVEAKLKEKNHG